MCTFIHKLARGKLQQHKLTLPTKELATIITSFLPIGFAPQRSFAAFLFLLCFVMTSNTAMIINIGPICSLLI